MFAFALCLVLLVTVCSANFFESGPHNVSHFEKGLLDIPDFAINWNVNVWAPKTPGNYPVYVYVTGGGGMAPGAMYTSFMSHVASHGIVTIALSKVLFPDAPKYAIEVQEFMDGWMSNKLQAELPAGVVADLDAIALGGHSAGNHVVAQTVAYNCGKVKALALTSPVDGADPFGFVDEYVIPEDGSGYAPKIPMFMQFGSLESKINLLVACAPEKMSGDRWYNAWMEGAPVWKMNVTNWGTCGVLVLGRAMSLHTHDLWLRFCRPRRHFGHPWCAR
jgi:hypothetical protein